MGVAVSYRGDTRRTLPWSGVTGAVGDSVTVLPVVVAVAVLTELSLAVVALWLGIFQVLWGLYDRMAVSVEPMKPLWLSIAGTLTARGVLVAGLLGFVCEAGGDGREGESSDTAKAPRLVLFSIDSTRAIRGVARIELAVLLPEEGQRARETVG